jgi:hypothetical protein
MVHESVKSPLLWSIGGVGLVAGGVIALSYWNHHQANAPTAPSAIPPVTAPAEDRFIPTATDPWERALEFGWEAAVAAQTAETELNWRRVGDLWLQAIAELEQVPPESPRRAEVPAKIEAYLANFDYAEGEKAKARAGAPAASSSLTADSLKAALAEAPMQVTFSAPAQLQGQPVTRGEATAGQARVELIGPAENLTQIKLVLPNLKGAGALSMAQMVYANQFLNATGTHGVGQSGWVATSLRQIQADPNQTITQAFGTFQVTLGPNARTNEVVVTIRPRP